MRNGTFGVRQLIVLAAATTALALGLQPAASAQGTPTFSKQFLPSTIGPGSVSTLRFTIANPSSVGVQSLSFTNSLLSSGDASGSPSITIATPASASSTCSGGTVSAPDGGDTIDFSGGSLGASGACSIDVNVTSAVPGSHENTSGDLTSSAGNSGSATATLTVDAGRPGFSKSFSPSSVLFGGRSTLTFTIDNTANPSQIFNPIFVDNLPSGIQIASPTNAVTTCSGGTLSATAGGGSITFQGAIPTTIVAAGASCTVSVDVVGAAVGIQNNVSGDLTSTVSGPQVDSGKATAALTVSADRLLLTKEFVDDPVPPGGQVNLLFTLRNRDRSETATDIAFTDDLDATLSGLAATSLPSEPCGTGSSLSGTSLLSLSGGSLAAGDSCSFTVTLDIPSGATPGSYSNTTSTVDGTIGTIGTTPVGGAAASDTLFVVAAPLLTKTFLDNPVAAGGMTTIEFSIINTSTSPATDIAFTDVLTDFLPFPISATLPASGFCGAGSSIALVSFGVGSQGLSITSGSLAAGPGTSCTFTVDVDIPVDTPSTTYVNQTSPVTATIDGETVSGNAANASLEVVRAPSLTKEFLDDPTPAGGTVSLQFTLTQPGETGSDATSIAFTDDLTATLSGLVATGLPLNDVCGTGSQISGTGNLSFSGGTLAPGESCSFVVTLAVPSGAVPGAYPNTTSNTVALVGGLSAAGTAGDDVLYVGGLKLSKQFTNDPVVAGEPVDLEFTIDNTSGFAATDIAFSDNLSQVLSGLVGTGLPLSDVCGTGSSLLGGGGGSNLLLVGGNLGVGESCTFTVTLQVPSNADSESYPNATSALSATINGNSVALPGASDVLTVTSNLLMLTKEFTDDPVAPGGSVNLEFVLTNTADREISAIAFTDDLDAALSGLASTSGSVADVCGTGSQITGTDTLSLTGGDLAAGASCTFSVTVAVPASAETGSVAVNTTSQVTGILLTFPVVGDPASDELRIDTLQFSKSFGGVANPGGTVQLTFHIENPSATATADRLSFTDDLSAVISGLEATDLPQSDACGLGSVFDGTDFLALTGGVLLPGGSCTFSTTLSVPAGTAAGDYVNITNDLTRDGILAAGPATATLTIEEIADSDGDGVLDPDDFCPDTVIPEGVPTKGLGTNRYALVDDDNIFDTNSPPGGGSGATFTTEDTAGCSCEQIIAAAGLGQGHVKFGCSKGAMEDWIDFINQ